MLVPRVVAADDAESLEYIFDGMDIKFLERLMRTGLKQTDQSTIMLDIAVPVISSFASHAQIAAKPRMLERIPTLLNVIGRQLPQVSNEATQAVCRIMSTDDGAESVLESPEGLIKAIDSLGSADPADGDLVSFVDFALNRLSTFANSGRGHGLLSQWVELVMTAAALFDDNQQMLKFELIGVLASALEPIDQETAADADTQRPCGQLTSHTISGCVSVLRQKSETTQYADQALVLASHLVRLWPDCVFTDKRRRGKEPDDQRKQSDLILRLACIEGQSSIDSMMISPPPAKGKPDQPRLKRGWKLPFCAEIAAGWLEWVARWLDEQEPESDDIDEEGIYSAMGSVQKLAAAAIGFLVDWRDRVERDQEVLEASPTVCLSTVRLLTQWLATDPKLHSDALPLLTMFTRWIKERPEHSTTLQGYLRPCITFALDTCGIDEGKFVKDLQARELTHTRGEGMEFASPWVGSIEFDDLAYAVYNIPSDEEILAKRQG
ncbi:hypothetical protein FBU59_002311 [Linderina macrospora]|uniref:Uncharacterized protein n=1 Tax=Linderina macrospora TaxID=4868 RepID=A0ACC1JBU6_9FUNG|nr:hypothetical protein FBU59_002311 [Linderina macrospora]